MEYLLTTIWVFLDYSAVLIFCSALLKKKSNPVLLIFLPAVILSSLISFLPVSSFIKQVSRIGLIIIVTFVLLDGSWIKHFLGVFIAIIFIGIIDTFASFGTCTLLHISFSDFVWKKLLYVAVTSISKLIAVLLAYVYFLSRANSLHSIKDTWLWLTVLFPTTSLINIIAIFANLQKNTDLSPASFAYIIALLLSNVAILYLIGIMEKKATVEQQMRLLRQQMSIQTDSILSLEKSYREQRRASHEFIHHIQTISTLLEHGDDTALKDYIEEIQSAHTSRIFAINSHHPVLDAILNQKYQQATLLGAEIQFQINDLSNVHLPAQSLVVLFSNLLDNAIEACEKVHERKQIFCNVISSDVLYISIRNSSDPVEIQDGYIKSTKGTQDHGYGLLNVYHILDALNAEYVLEYKNGWFCFAAEIPNTEHLR